MNNDHLTAEQQRLIEDTGINLGDDLSTQGANSARAAMQRSLGADDDGYVHVPNGGKIKVSDLVLDHDYLAGDYSSIFTDTEKHLKDPKPGAVYVWARANDPLALGRVRTHQYRRVELDELKDDTELPVTRGEGISSQKNAGKKEYVQMFDVQLMEVPPEVAKRLFRLPAAQAIMKTAGSSPFEALRRRVEDMTQGGASVEVTRKEVMSPIE